MNVSSEEKQTIAKFCSLGWYLVVTAIHQVLPGEENKDRDAKVAVLAQSKTVKKHVLEILAD